MRVKKSSGTVPTPAQTKPPATEGTTVKIPHDPVNEAAVIVAALTDPQARADISRRLIADNILVKENRVCFAAIIDLHRQGITPDPSSIAAVAGEEVGRHAGVLLGSVSPPQNVEWHITNVLWDYARAVSAMSTVPEFLEALTDPRSSPDKVRSLARRVSASYDSFEDRRFLLNKEEVIRAQMVDVDRRLTGKKFYPFGLPALDYRVDGTKRIATGATPKHLTILTAISGGGKSTVAAHSCLGVLGWERVAGEAHYEWKAGSGRKVLYGAMEMQGGVTLELLATITLGWSRTEVRDGVGHLKAPDGRAQLDRRMNEIAESGFSLLANPFRRNVSDKASNDRNLDILQSYIAASGCSVFYADLWERCLVKSDPESEKQALFRQQMIAEECDVHCVLLAQQRMKGEDGIERREDTRPTREGIKGSGAWVEVADNIIGVHYPYLTKGSAQIDELELLVLKQRYGPWPFTVSCKWDPDRGSIESQGQDVEHQRGRADDAFLGIGSKRR